MEDIVYIDRDPDLYLMGSNKWFGIRTFVGMITLRPGEAREVRDAITHWLDNREED